MLNFLWNNVSEINMNGTNPKQIQLSQNDWIKYNANSKQAGLLVSFLVAYHVEN